MNGAVTCPSCGGQVGLQAGGKIADHLRRPPGGPYMNQPRCDGSGQTADPAHGGAS